MRTRYALLRGYCQGDCFPQQQGLATKLIVQLNHTQGLRLRERRVEHQVLPVVGDWEKRVGDPRVEFGGGIAEPLGPPDIDHFFCRAELINKSDTGDHLGVYLSHRIALKVLQLEGLATHRDSREE